MNLSETINIPIDSHLFNKILNENIKLKLKIQELINDKSCGFSIEKSPEVIVSPRINSHKMTLTSSCSIESHDHQLHVICKTLNTDNQSMEFSFQYFIDELIIHNATEMDFLMILSEMHKNLLNEIYIYMSKNRGDE